MNGYVRVVWPSVSEVGGRRLLRAWYDRPFEYAWALVHLMRLESEVGRPLRVLDIGPGAYQPWIDELAQRGHQVAAIDRDADVVLAVAGRLPAVSIRAADGKIEDVSGYDLVTCLSVIEHDLDWRGFARNLFRARRLLLTFGVIRDGYTWHDMFVGEAGAREVALMVEVLGARVIGELDLPLPADAVVGLGGAGLTFVLATERL